MQKIFVIDDDYSIRLLYQEKLEDKGYEISATDSCADISEVIRRVRPDLIILDIVMGSFDGLKILQEIRNT